MNIKFTNPFVIQADQYARDILAGKIPSCNLVKNACKRYVKDLANPDYYIDELAVNRVCSFIQLLCHVKGEWSLKKELLKLAPPQLFILTNIYGFKLKKNKLRRFRKALLWVCRKNGKSSLAAPLCLYHLTADNEAGPEVYVGASSRAQAKEVFSPAREMAVKTPALVKRFGLDVRAETILNPSANGKMEMVIAKSKDGQSPSLWILDELHQHKDSTQYDAAITGSGSRSQPLILVITTAGTSLQSFEYQKRQEIERIINGQEDAPDTFGLIYTIDPEDDWQDFNNVIKANPMMGISISEDYLRAQHADALRNAQSEIAFKIKHLNIPVAGANAWLSGPAILNCVDEKLTEEWAKLNCPFSCGAIDLSSKLDLTSYGRVYARYIDGLLHYYVFSDNYLPSDTIYNSTHKAYVQWVEQGHLRSIPGAQIDQNVIKHRVLETTPLNELVYDSYSASMLAKELENEGLEPIEFQQTVKNYSPSMREFEAAIASGRLHIAPNPVVTWCLSNVQVRVDQNQNVFPRKGSQNAKIDAAITAIMCVGRLQIIAVTPQEEVEEPLNGIGFEFF